MKNIFKILISGLSTKENYLLEEYLNQQVDIELTPTFDGSSYQVFDAVKLVGIDDFFIKVILSNEDAKVFGKSSIRRITPAKQKRLRSAA